MIDSRIVELIEAYARADSNDERNERIKALREHFRPTSPPSADLDQETMMKRAIAVVQTNPEEAERIVREFIGAPAFAVKSLADWQGKSEPLPIIWRDKADQDRDDDSLAPVDAVVSVGEPGLISAPGGSGKSYMTLALAHAATEALAKGEVFGQALGLRVRAGPVIFVAYEDSPVRMAGRLFRMHGTISKDILLVEEPEPLYVGADSYGRGNTGPGPQWAELWTTAKTISPSLIVVDPASEALADTPVSETGPVRDFLRAVTRASEAIGAGVLIVSHDTKAARNAARLGDDPGAGAVAGSSAWFDRARGVLYVYRHDQAPNDRIVECIKANHGRIGWGVRVREEFKRERFTGFKFVESLSIDGVREALRAASAAQREGRGKAGDKRRAGVPALSGKV